MSDFDKVVRGFELLLEGLGYDMAADPGPHVGDTPERAARAWYNELCRGMTGEPPSITTFPHNGEPSLILLRNIPVKSLCAHHMLPFVGTASVGYVSGNRKILGLSKLSRITDYWARRPQVQERLTEQIADDLWGLVGRGCYDPAAPAGGVGVVISASHMCMSLRGVEHDGEMITSALRGVFRTQPETRAEFLSLAKED